MCAMTLAWKTTSVGFSCWQLLIFSGDIPLHQAPSLSVQYYLLKLAFWRPFLIFEDAGFRTTENSFVLCSLDIKHFLSNVNNVIAAGPWGRSSRSCVLQHRQLMHFKSCGRAYLLFLCLLKKYIIHHYCMLRMWYKFQQTNKIHSLAKCPRQESIAVGKETTTSDHDLQQQTERLYFCFHQSHSARCSRQNSRALWCWENQQWHKRRILMPLVIREYAR